MAVNSNSLTLALSRKGRGILIDNGLIMACKIKKGDQVVVISGKDKGRRGEVRQSIGGERLLIDGINIVRKHRKGNPQKNIQGGIVDEERSIHISNVAIYNPVTKKADRIGFKNLADAANGGQRKVRYFKSNNEIIDA